MLYGKFKSYCVLFQITLVFLSFYSTSKPKLHISIGHKNDWHSKKQKKKKEVFLKYFFGKYDQICRKLQIWSHSLKKSLMENFIFCAVWSVILQ